MSRQYNHSDFSICPSRFDWEAKEKISGPTAGIHSADPEICNTDCQSSKSIFGARAYGATGGQVLLQPGASQETILIFLPSLFNPFSLIKMIEKHAKSKLFYEAYECCFFFSAQNIFPVLVHWRTCFKTELSYATGSQTLILLSSCKPWNFKVIIHVTMSQWRFTYPPVTLDLSPGVSKSSSEPTAVCR